MPKYRLTVECTAEVREEWLVEAESEDAAAAMVDEGRLHEGEFVRDWIAGDERNRTLTMLTIEPEHAPSSEMLALAPVEQLPGGGVLA